MATSSQGSINTYKTILAEAVRGYNKIQNALAENAVTEINSVIGVGSAGSTVSNLSTADQMVSAIKKLTKNGSCTITGGGLTKGAASGGELKIISNFSKTPDVNISLNSSESNISEIYLQNTKPSDGYYIKLRATSSEITGTTKVSREAFSQKITRAAIEESHEAGYIAATQDPITAIQSTSTTVSLAGDTASPTVTINSGVSKNNEYLVIPAGSSSVSCSIGEISQEDSNGVKKTILTSTVPPNDYYKINITHLVKHIKTAGWITGGTEDIDGTGKDLYLAKGEVSPSFSLKSLESEGNSSLTITSKYFNITPNAAITEGYFEGDSVAGTAKNYKIKSGSATVSATITDSDPSLSGTTITLNANITPSITEGWISSGTAGSVTISATVPTQTKTASSAGDITPDTGKLLSKVTVPSGTLSNGATTGTTYTTVTTPSIPSGGYLYINPGWHSATKISLSSLIPDVDNDITYDSTTKKSNQILSGYKAYDEDGTLVEGNIATLSLSDTYFTTTDTGYGVVTADKFTGSTTKYIKAGSATVSAKTTDNDPSLSGTTITLNANVTPSITEGWISSGTSGSIEISATVPTQEKTAYAAVDITPDAGKLLSKVIVPSGTVTQSSNTFSDINPVLSGTNGDVITLNAEVIPAVTKSGWVSPSLGPVAGNVTIYATVPTQTKTASSAGDITPDTGKLLNKVTVPSGSLTVNNPTTNVTHGTITPSVNISNASTYGFTTTEPTNGSYVTIDPNASYSGGSASSSVIYSSAKGWISDIESTTKNSAKSMDINPSISEGNNYYIPEASISLDTVTIDSEDNFLLSNTSNTGIPFTVKIDYETTAGVISSKTESFSDVSYNLEKVSVGSNYSLKVDNSYEGTLTVNNMAGTVNFIQNDSGNINIDSNYGGVSIKNIDDFGSVEILDGNNTDLLASIETAIDSLESAINTLGIPALS